MQYFTLANCGNIGSVLDPMGFTKTSNMDDADMVIFGGGTDISPSLYKQVPIKETSAPDVERDKKELAVYKSLKPSVWKIGICRGSQLLCALAGGSLWQHTDNHAGRAHTLTYYDPDTKDWQETITNSVHHQVCRPPDEAIILGMANESTVLKDAKEYIHVNNYSEVEVWAHLGLKIFGFQGHPEYGQKETVQVFTKLLKAVLEGKVK